MATRLLSGCVFALAIAAVGFAGAGGPIRLNEKQYFEAPGFSFLVFHNNYQVGFQGGLQMIQADERLLDTGDLFIEPEKGRAPERRAIRREVDAAAGRATVFAEVPEWKLGYEIETRTDGETIFVTLRVNGAMPARVRRAGFRIALYPGAYFSKSFQTEDRNGVFPRQFLEPVLLAGCRRLTVAEEDPQRRFTIGRTDGGTMELRDSRRGGPESWFWVEAPFAKGASEVRVEITPTIDPAWRRAPVLAMSQVGYHPNQPKRIVIELDPRDDGANEVRLLRLETGAEPKLVKSAAAKPWGNFLRYKYATFDFSEVREPGMYVAEFRGRRTAAFRIADDVYRGVWEPTLEYFLPAQMCHVAVKEGVRTWHGPCHLDDGLQAPAHTVYIDGYQQGERETPFADNQHIAGLDWGGWHDAGDFDLPAGSIAQTTLALALAQEEFRPGIDDTAVRRKSREVLLHEADGKPDLIEQIQYGVEGLLASYRVAGYIFPGIIASTEEQYNYLGDPVNITDNRVYDPKSNPVRDDRWVFTNRNTGLDYESAQALAAASRVLKEYSPAAAKESLAAAEKLWGDEQKRTPVYAPSAYAPRDSGFRAQEMAATAELLITTGEGRYRERLLSFVPALKGLNAEQFESVGEALVRALPAVKDEGYRAAVASLAGKWKAEAGKRAASNPFGVEYPEQVSSPEYTLEARSGIHSGFVWGHGWKLQSGALASYYYHKYLPDMFGKEDVFRVVDFVLGCHPASDESFVSGVGAHSAIIAYGYNRADWSNIPGGVISGTSLIKPDYMELKEFPFLWYQTEYVIGGAATYIFDVLAAERLAGERE